MLIPTQNKSKVHQGWSHPVGSEIVSDALADVNQFGSIYLSFLMPMRGVEGEPMSIGGTDYTPPDMTMMERNWRIYIYAVPSVHRALGRELLCEQVLPRFQTWFTAPRSPIWYDTSQGLHASFNWQTERVEFREMR